MRNFVIGQYVPGDSYVYKLDPRTKIIVTLLLMISVFFLESIYQILGALVLIIVILLSARLSIIKAIKGLKPLVVLSVFVFVFQIFFNTNGRLLTSQTLSFSVLSIASSVLSFVLYLTLVRYTKFKSVLFILMVAMIYLSFRYLPSFPNTFSTYELKIYSEGLNTSLFVFFRLITIVFIATILTLTTKPTDLTLGFEWLMKPLKVFKINSEEIALIISIALRYIPTILDEAYKIMDAQASRGADLKEGSIFRKIKQVVSLLVPMFVISFERSDQLADAMLSRNFVPGKPKTRYHVLKFRTLDIISIIFSFIALGGSICLFIIF